MKALELKTKTSVNSDIEDLPLRCQVYQGKLLASFQDDANHGGFCLCSAIAFKHLVCRRVGALREIAMLGLFFVVVEIDPYLGRASFDYVYSYGGFYLCHTIAFATMTFIQGKAIAFAAMKGFIIVVQALLLAIVVLLRSCICEYAITKGCWNTNVVVNSDLGGAARHHAFSHAIFDASLSIL
nr:hypothetical protein [Tanacetum cinerariifolium]